MAYRDFADDYNDVRKLGLSVAGAVNKGWAMESDGAHLRLNRRSLASPGYSPVISAGSLPDDSRDHGFVYDAGLADFIAVGFGRNDGLVRVVIPQREPVPDGAVYRKLGSAGWGDFIVDGKNAVYSAKGEPGVCPAAGSDVYEAGLLPGAHCVQLLIEDGGPNDADGVVNGVVDDPGGVARDADLQESPPMISVRSSGGLGALALYELAVMLAWFSVLLMLRARRSDNEMLP